MAQQIGLIKSLFNNRPNATKCMNIKDVQESHMQKRHTITVGLDNIYGMLVLLGIGVGGATLTLMGETTFMVRQKS